MDESKCIVSIIIPVYNEECVIDSFYSELSTALATQPEEFEIIYVNDGSKDQTQTILEALQQSDSRIRVLQLSRNFGHQAALCAGMEAARGEYIITMDGDGQHPPALIAEMLRLARSGYDMVLSQRLDDQSKPSFKRWSSQKFYHLINRISDTETVEGGADFRLLSRQVLNELIAMPEYHRFLRGMVSWLGFRSVILPFTPPQRIAGETKYSLKKMFRLGSDAIFSFSMAPLYIGLSGGALFLLLALIEAIYVLSLWIHGDMSSLTPGWSSLMFMLLIIGAILMVILGFIGIYIGYIFQEVKHRPVYIIQKETPQAQTEKNAAINRKDNHS